ncbi:MAG: DUF4476 domain-containing protein [Dolichospermum sp. DET50]|nr:DUF4476 domain-containing protein [Dolichospermum sp. DET66]MBS3031192.1 DUF4476 domain-containing protein [Dolichospermum sp. DET67]MBS3036402.1 DUF4476 domain-containing protein [Dolichospermum sp. DET50]QSX68459.1 MAG: DUF4476 domain-containing protein [Dolichospermum sp. DET69]
MNFAKVFLATATLMVVSISPTLANDKVEISDNSCTGESSRVNISPNGQGLSILFNKFIIWGNRSHSCPISDSDFSQLMDDLRRSWPNELQFLIQIVPQNYFTSVQASQIVKEMKFGDREVEAAVMLYPQVVDHGNWFVVEQAITFESDRQEVRRKINDTNVEPTETKLPNVEPTETKLPPEPTETKLPPEPTETKLPNEEPTETKLPPEPTETKLPPEPTETKPFVKVKMRQLEKSSY